MFTDEKIFTKNGYFNPHNDVIWADDRSDANERGGLNPIEKYPVHIMVTLGVTWEGVTRPYFFLKGDRLFGHTEGCFQQDNASCHTDRKVQN